MFYWRYTRYHSCDIFASQIRYNFTSFRLRYDINSFNSSRRDISHPSGYIAPQGISQIPSGIYIAEKKDRLLSKSVFFLVGGDGFEPSKRDATDLQSAPFGHSGTLPKNGAGDGTRTRDLLITNQLLYQLSYTSLYIVSC